VPWPSPFGRTAILIAVATPLTREKLGCSDEACPCFDEAERGLEEASLRE
jgi:hypothetical protein